MHRNGKSVCQRKVVARIIDKNVAADADIERPLTAWLTADGGRGRKQRGKRFKQVF